MHRLFEHGPNTPGLRRGQVRGFPSWKRSHGPFRTVAYASGSDVVVLRIAHVLDSLGARCGQVLFDQSANRSRPALRQPTERFQLDGFAVRAQDFEKGRLLGSQRRQRFRPKRLRHKFDQYDIVRPGPFAHLRRHHGVEHLTPAAQIIIREPARQLQQFGVIRT